MCLNNKFNGGDRMNLQEFSGDKEYSISQINKYINMDFKKYNWVDVKEFAKNIFWNYSFEMPWAEDAWNILMKKKSILIWKAN
jgi:hypothetical protein